MSEKLYDNGYDAPFAAKPPGQPPVNPAGQSAVPGHTPEKTLAGPAWLAIVGGLSAILGFLLLYTPVFLKYNGGSLSDVHAICNSGIGVLGRLLNATAGSECGSINNWFAVGQFALWAGLAVAVAGVTWLLVRHNSRQAS
jgi:hypothetical protein